VTAQQRGDRRGRNTDAELLALSFNPHVAPPRVLPGHAQDQSPDLGIKRGPSRRPLRVRPLLRHESSMPAKQRLGTHEERIPALAGQHAACGSQQCAIPHPVSGALHLTAQDRYLVAQHEILKADLLGGAIPEGKDGEQSTEHHVEERGEHGRDSVTHGRLGVSGARNRGPEGHDRVFVPDGLGHG
jgi:hypothetical protein